MRNEPAVRAGSDVATGSRHGRCTRRLHARHAGDVMHATKKEVLTSPRKLWELARDSVTAWVDDFAPSMGAAISYYTVFSIAPLLLIVIAVVGFFFGQEAATGKILDQLRGMMGDEAAAGIQGMVKSASDPGKGLIATIIGFV